jgi:hypothetical protein
MPQPLKVSNMLSNELRLGNFLNSGKVVRINADNFTIFDGFQELDSLTMPDIWITQQPKVLTEIWLERFGFKINMDNFDWNAGIGTNCIGDFELSLRHTDNVGWFYKSKCTPIKYVHQLQNLYFALTGKELTIKTN